MGFKKVYNALQDIFPELDSRVLRAVAIEHCKDPDAAVVAVLTEVIPFLTERSKPLSASSSMTGAVAESSPDAVDFSQTSLGNYASPKALCGQDQLLCETAESSVGVVPTYVCTTVTSLDPNPLFADQSYDADKCVSSGVQELASKVNEECASKDYNGDNTEFFESLETAVDEVVFSESRNVAAVENDGLASYEYSSTAPEHIVVEKSFQSDSLNHVSASNIQSYESSAELAVEPENTNTDLEETRLDSFIEVSDTQLTGKILDDGMVSNSIVTRSGQMCSIDLLEDIIAEAGSNKKTMFAAMDSLITLMKEVELQEKAAEQAKEEAAMGGIDILRRVEDLKDMLRHAREANDMHAGEVYGEKAILATEVKELQSRLLNLADDRDKSLAILDEMRKTLEGRLEAAEREKEAAEQEKFQKEELARKALVEQELIMEKVVHESNILKQQAEENAKIREFLVDRGRIVDALQGEISVICQDVRFLKVKFDDRVPLSKSLSSSQTSCILASSSSSLKSVTPDSPADQSNSSDEQQKIDTVSAGENETGKDCKAVVDDGWELFDQAELCA